MKKRILVLGVLAVASVAWAQNAVVAIEDGTARPVREIVDGRPLIVVEGKRQISRASRFELIKVAAYRPGFVTITGFKVQVHHLEDMSTGGQFNYVLRIRGRAQSDTSFEKCFMLLELTDWQETGFVFAAMPNLEAGRLVDLNLSFRLEKHLQEGTYIVHLFAGGNELLHSKMPPKYVATQKQKTQELLVDKKQDFPAVVARQIKPLYPAKLKADKVSGSAKVRCRVTAKGDVAEAELVEATLPAFGEAALTAVRKWKFDPAIKGQRFIETEVVVPIEFPPPVTKA